MASIPCRPDLPTFAFGSRNGHGSPIPLQLRVGAITSEDGSIVILDAVSSQVFLGENTDGAYSKGGLILGSKSNKGSVNLLDISIGQLHATRILVAARNKLWWMCPEWPEAPSAIPPETQFLLAELGNEGPYVLMLPLIDGAFRATLRPPKSKSKASSNDLCLRIESGDAGVVKDSWNAVLLVTAHTNPFVLLDEGVASAAALSGTSAPSTTKAVPPHVGLFGWCTWDAFYSSVSARGVMEGLTSLNRGGVTPRFLIIDDGWQTTDVDLEFRKKALPSADDPPTPADMSDSASHPSNGASATSSAALLPNSPAQGRTIIPAAISSRLAAIWGVIMTWILGVATALFVIVYQWVVDPAAPGSFAVRGFAALTKGPLRGMMLGFFSSASDFTKRLVSVAANSKFSHPDAGPEDEWKGQEGLKHVVEAIRERFGIRLIYCWHGLPAYWAGVMPGEKEMEPFGPEIVYAQPTPGVLEIEPSMAWNPAVLGGIGVARNAPQLYNSMHAYLKSAGINGVKVDCQAGVGLIGTGRGGGPALASRFHAALEESISTHFPGNAAINCMCHSTENLYRFKSTNAVRASDDFYPRDPASSGPHIAACAYNSLFLAPLAVPDWDMFHSKHPAAATHAAARAVSGGPIYVSDKPGVHDFSLLTTLVLADGSTLVPLQPGRPTRDCLFRDPLRDRASALKVWSLNTAGGVIGVFNLQGSSWDRQRRRFRTHDLTPPNVAVRITPADIEPFRPTDFAPAGPPSESVPASPGPRSDLGPRSDHGSVAASTKFAVYMFYEKQLRLCGAWDSVDLDLSPGQAEILTIVPIATYSRSTESIAQAIHFAPIGLVSKMNSGGAVLAVTFGDSADVSEEPGKKLTEVRMHIRGFGVFLAYTNIRPMTVKVNGVGGAFCFDESAGSLHFDVPDAETIQSDVAFTYG